MAFPIDASKLKFLAREAGFELAGIAAAEPLGDRLWYGDWVRRGMAGRMSYLTDHRAELRMDPKSLLPSARTILCTGKVYNGPQAYSTTRTRRELGWISRYAWERTTTGLFVRASRKWPRNWKVWSTGSASTPRHCSSAATHAWPVSDGSAEIPA